MEIMKKIKTYTLFVTILYVIMGLIMLLNPQFILDAVNYIVGIFVLLYGIIYIIKFFGRGAFDTLSKFSLLPGILCILFGIYILINPTLLSSIIPLLAGILLLVDGFGKLKDALSFKKSGYLKWWIGLLIAIIFFGLGIFMIVKALNVSKIVVQIIGAVLIVDAITDIWSYFCYKKYPPAKKQELKKELEDVKEANIVEVKEK